MEFRVCATIFEFKIFSKCWVWVAADGLCGTCPWHPGKRFPCCGSRETGLQTGKGWSQAELGDLQCRHLSHRTLGKAHELVTAQLPYGQNGRKVKPASKNFMRILDNACKACSTVPSGKWRFCCWSDWSSFVILCVHLNVWESEVSSNKIHDWLLLFSRQVVPFLHVWTMKGYPDVGDPCITCVVWHVAGKKSASHWRTHLPLPVKSEDSLKYIFTEWGFVSFHG